VGFRLVALVALLGLAAQQPSEPKPAQDPQRPVFRGGTQYVRVDAYPTRDGRIIEGLTAGDFELFEDGKAQAVAAADFVAFDPLPDDDRGTIVSAREGLELAADSRYRVIVFVIDREAFDREQWPEMRDALIGFLEREVTPRDLLGILTTDRQWSDLVIGRRLSEIQREIDAPEWIQPVISEQTAALNGCGLESMRGRVHADETYALLEGVVRLLGQVREDRTSIVYVSHGLNRQGPNRRAAEQRPLALPPPIGLVNGRIQRVPRATDMHDQFCKSELRRLAETDFGRRFDDLITLARASNVAFYPVAVPLLVPMVPLVARDSIIARTAPKRAVRVDSGFGVLAADTDGLMIPGEADVSRGLRRIVEDTTAHYLLGYYSTNPKADGRIRTIKVRLKKNGSVVRARPYYRAPTKEDIKTLAAAPARVTIVAPPYVVAALDALSRSRPSSQFHAYAAVAGPTLTVVVEVPAAAVEAGRWSDGAALEVIAEADGGDTSAMGRGRLAPNGRAVLRLPISGPAPSRVLVRLRAEGESLVERTSLSGDASRLIGDPLGYRSGPRGLAIPVALFEFTREEKLRLDWPLLGKVDSAEVRLLDRRGQPLRHRVSSALQDTADGPRVAAELAFSPLGRGDYVVELAVTSAAVTERKVVALRVK
jgi:VWFA-related protein